MYSDNCRFTSGDVNEAISVMREAAGWLIEIGRPMWMLDELNREHINNPPDEFIVMWKEDESVAALTLSFRDSVFWPGVLPDTSGFIHKLSVRRKYAGTGAAERFIEHCAYLCKNRGIFSLRLDCDPHREGLCRLYERCGFTLKEIKVFQTKRLGNIDVAMYELDF